MTASCPPCHTSSGHTSSGRASPGRALPGLALPRRLMIGARRRWPAASVNPCAAPSSEIASLLRPTHASALSGRCQPMRESFMVPSGAGIRVGRTTRFLLGGNHHAPNRKASCPQSAAPVAAQRHTRGTARTLQSAPATRKQLRLDQRRTGRAPSGGLRRRVHCCRGSHAALRGCPRNGKLYRWLQVS